MENIQGVLHYIEDYVDFKIGDIVFLTTDPEQLERVVYSYTIYPTHIIYSVAQGLNTSGHFGFELTTEKKVF